MIEIVSGEVRSLLGEGAWWSARDDAFYWVDILGRRLNRWRAASSPPLASWDVPEMIGWVIERQGTPGFVAGLQSGVHVIDLDPFRCTPLAAFGLDEPEMRLNDACADAHGNIWAGTMRIAADRPVGALYRFDPAGDAVRVDTGYTVPNGPAISRDGQLLYHADSPLGLVYRLRLDDPQRTASCAVHIAFDPSWGKPDGMTVDADDCLWVCHWDGGRVSRFDPSGALMRSIEVPASRVTNCAFGGADLDQLYITTAAKDRPDEPLAGAIFRADPGVRGVPANRYAG
ncbi:MULTISPECIES: SMP-30/gluconolactonase/LRE family protein [unclassified Sphingomonas]|uniref:SMP-30/gluconolactonase/LRE family protein n=1 Tax=unclassified Sphingomonas TaxID=196159 RepID=UPI0008339AFB|nr:MULTISPECIES: SMP-30/gluconolactonase/LRE family protein [unclassified Sphingomonas]